MFTLLRETKEPYYKQYFSDDKKTPETSVADYKRDNKHEKQIG